MITDAHKAKAKEIRAIIRKQPPEVIACLSDFCGLDDGEPMFDPDIHETVNNYFDSVGYEEGTDEVRLAIQNGMKLPNIEIICKITKNVDGEQDGHDWEIV